MTDVSSSMSDRLTQLERENEQLRAELHHLRSTTDNAALFNSIVENAQDGIAIAGEDTIITYANQAFCTMTGLGEQTVGTSFLSIYDDSTRSFIQSEVIPAMFEQGRWQGKLPARRPDGSTWTLQISCFVVTRPSDNQTQWVAFLRDSSTIQAESERRQIFEYVVEQANLGIVMGRLDTNEITYVNPAMLRIAKYARREDMVGKPSIAFFEPQDVKRIEEEIVPTLIQGKLWEGEMRAIRADKISYPIHLSTLMVTGIPNMPPTSVSFVRDLTHEQEAAQEHLRLQEELIAAQQAALRELSTPLIPVADDVVIMPLIGSIDSTRTQMVIDTLLEGVATLHARTAIIDITGVPVVDTQVANTLLRAAQAVKLLGAQVLLTGIRPEVAQTLVGLGADLSGIITRSTLQSGITYALRPRQ